MQQEEGYRYGILSIESAGLAARISAESRSVVEGLVLVCRWVYRNPYSILDPNAVDAGRGSKNGTVDSQLSAISKTYQPRLRYSHMSTLSHLPNGSIAAQWQVRA